MSKRRGHADNEGLQQRLKARERRAAAQLDEDLRHVLADPAGRRVMWWLLDGLTNLHGSTFTGNSQTFHLEGRRSVGIDLMIRMKSIDPTLYTTMIAEQMAALAEDNLIKREAEADASRTKESYDD